MMDLSNAGFEQQTLFGRFAFSVGSLPGDLAAYARERFDEIWNLHPSEFKQMPQPRTGKLVPLPRWNQDYEHEYRYPGSDGALPLPPLLRPFLDWAQAVDPRLNGLLATWYDATHEHHIGAHRDKVKGLIPNSSIITVSLGEERTWRLRPWKGPLSERIDLPVRHSMVLVVPLTTNLGVTHQVLKRASDRGRRISLTIRAFE